ncbi:uncharacterized protein LOC124459419 [Xenia sp. Carnegie-2017]|uniref:uncharacterized protein LOC124459419 n=1 Tax=Xenia sp. Carnegie-2017 TaxID=2897299 RepID=UPI001F045D83|nr:uncharacterized protein LOC124459419 [Xenia sp. Carnegie-2017]XP_046864835.1 uncharacterized protein LOC124459419 [Xenia sp. Carnegie-2017]XP_046864836.1 uncharacterized protein LOC124459419 [Xenia sp. Carnegie-2017]
MSMSTSYRYEVENPTSVMLKKSLRRQKQRIRNYEIMNEKTNAVRSDIKTILLADWVEKLDETCFKKKAKRHAEEVKQELHHGNEELILVRRAQLQNLLMKEEKSYRDELEKLDKTFYLQRI